MLLKTAYYRDKRPNRWVRACSVCEEKSSSKFILSFDDGKRTICASKIGCVKKIFPSFIENEDAMIQFGKFRCIRDKGLECDTCKSMMFDGIIILTKSSSIQINKYKKGCCGKCLGGVIAGDKII